MRTPIYRFPSFIPIYSFLYGGGGANEGRRSTFLCKVKWGWTVFQMWETCFNLTHAQHPILLHGIIVVTNLKLTSQKENDINRARDNFFFFYKIDMLTIIIK